MTNQHLIKKRAFLSLICAGLVAACGGGGNTGNQGTTATGQTGSSGSSGSPGSAGSSGGTSTNAQVPSIETQPADATVATDSSASLSVTASGADPLSYQWRRNGVAIVSATSATYTTPALAVADGGSKYDVVVTGSGGSVTSSVATVTVTLHSGFNRLIGLQKTAGASDGDSTSALFNAPAGTVTDTNGNIFVADAGNFAIRKISPAYAVTTLAGQAGASGFQDGTGSGALFGGTGEWIGGHVLNGSTPVPTSDTTVRAPQIVSLDTDQNVLLADAAHNVLRKVTQAGVVTTFAGTPNTPGTSDGATSTALLNLPLNVAAGGTTTYFVDVVLPATSSGSGENYSIRKVTSAAQASTVSRAWTSVVNEPIAGLAFSAGTLYFISSATTTAASNGLYRLNQDGTATILAGDTGSAVPMLLGSPRFLTAGGDGMLYVVEGPLTKIYRVSPTGTVTLLFDYSSSGLPGALGGMSVTGDNKNLLVTIDNALFLLPLPN
ncbi:MAG TPA: hypothetical protein VF534_06900 [Paraburkholderia sp.]